MIIYLLYTARPRPLDFASILHLLDSQNLPLSVRRLAEEIDFLRSSKLLRVFPVGATAIVDDVAQAKLMQRFSESEGELNDDYAACLTTKGVNYQEEHFETDGVTRVG